ncbi:MAG: methyltransferase domain-containing protein [Candidatus Falkowbacteria bacterium]
MRAHKYTIRSVNDLRKIAHRGGRLSFERKPALLEKNRRLRLFDMQTAMRIYLIRKIVKLLYGKTGKFLKILECGSAGDISCALALSGARVYGLDIDYKIFANEINCIPNGVWKIIKIKRPVAYYGQTNEAHLNFVKKSLTNYERIIGDYKKLPFPDESLDVGLTQGTPEVLSNSISELFRVIRSGGYIINIIHESIYPDQKPFLSFYDTGNYHEWDEYKALNPREYGLRLKKIDIPSEFKKLERLKPWYSNYDFHQQRKVNSGFIFEVFQK